MSINSLIHVYSIRFSVLSSATFFLSSFHSHSLSMTSTSTEQAIQSRRSAVVFLVVSNRNPSISSAVSFAASAQPFGMAITSFVGMHYTFWMAMWMFASYATNITTVYIHRDGRFISVCDAHLNKWNCHKKCLRIFALMRVSSSFLLCHKRLFAYKRLFLAAYFHPVSCSIVFSLSRSLARSELFVRHSQRRTCTWT